MIFLQALRSEFLKLKRTKITWIVGVLFAFAPLGIAFFMLIIKNPELARNMGLITAKAQMTVGAADWPTYLNFIPMVLAAGSMVIGIIAAFVFGREYAEGTAKNMLTLPIGRAVFVAAKLITAAVWYACVVIAVYGVALLVGALIGLDGFDPGLLATKSLLCLVIFFETILLGSVPAWFAIVGRGYLAPIGFTIFAGMVLGQMLLHTGWSQWYPWSIVFLSAGAGGSEAPVPGVASYLILVATFIAGCIASYFALDRSDNTQ